MASAGLALTNVALGLGNIGAGIGFGVAEHEKMEELDDKSKKLKDAVTTASNLYDHIYYLVAVNIDRVSKAIDKLPSDFVEKLEKQINSDIKESDAEKAIETVAKYMGYVGEGLGVFTGLLQLGMYLRKKRAEGSEEPTEPTSEPFEDVPLDGAEIPPTTETESSFAESPRLVKFANGLNVAGIVFGVAGLAATIGLGVWTLDKLNDAISDVEKKQTQVTKFQEALKKALDEVVKAAGLPEKSYADLIPMADTWKKISQNFDSYEKALYYAIQGYYRNLKFDKIKAGVEKESDKGKPFPSDGYPLAKTLADDIKYLIKKKKKTDKEIVEYFATENPKIGLRFVFDEYFISTMRFF